MSPSSMIIFWTFFAFLIINGVTVSAFIHQSRKAAAVQHAFSTKKQKLYNQQMNYPSTQHFASNHFSGTHPFPVNESKMERKQRKAFEKEAKKWQKKEKKHLKKGRNTAVFAPFVAGAVGGASHLVHPNGHIMHPGRNNGMNLATNPYSYLRMGHSNQMSDVHHISPNDPALGLSSRRGVSPLTAAALTTVPLAAAPVAYAYGKHSSRANANPQPNVPQEVDQGHVASPYSHGDAVYNDHQMGGVDPQHHEEEAHDTSDMGHGDGHEEEEEEHEETQHEDEMMEDGSDEGFYDGEEGEEEVDEDDY